MDDDRLDDYGLDSLYEEDELDNLFNDTVGMGLDVVNSDNTHTSNDTDDRMDNSKKAKISLIIGILLVCGIFIILGILGRQKLSGGSDIQLVSTSNSYNNSINNDALSKIKAIIDTQANTIDSQKNQLEQQSKKIGELKAKLSEVGNNANAGDTKWQEFTGGSELSFDKERDASFTVIDIKNYVSIGNVSDSMILKSVVKGNISGLVGEFDVEIPYSKARYLSVGTVLNINYYYSLMDNRVLVGQIVFED